MIGARDVAFARLDFASWYLYMLGGLFTVVALLAGGVDTGWTFYTPFSTMFSNTNMILVVIGVFITGYSSIFTGFNFIVTVHSLRRPERHGSACHCSCGRCTPRAGHGVSDTGC